jgi:hypothetical protein
MTNYGRSIIHPGFRFGPLSMDCPVERDNDELWAPQHPIPDFASLHRGYELPYEVLRIAKSARLSVL